MALRFRNADAGVVHAEAARAQGQADLAAVGVVKRVAQQVGDHRAQQWRGVAAVVGGLVFEPQAEAARVGVGQPALELFRGDVGEGGIGLSVRRAVGAAREPQEGFDQFAHFLAGAQGTDDLAVLAAVGGESFEQQFARTGDHHQRGAQLVAHIAGEEAFAVERGAQAAQGVVERGGKLADFVVGVIGRERRGERQQLVAVANLPGEADHRCDDAARGERADGERGEHAERPAGADDGEEHLLAALEFVLVVE